MSQEESNITAVHQPNFFPWMGYFLKIALSDVFIILDDVQLTWRGYSRRARIRKAGHPHGQQWLTLPLSGSDTFSVINKIEIRTYEGWQENLLEKLANSYRLSPYYGEGMDLAREVIYCQETNLAKFNLFGVKKVMERLGIAGRLELSSSTPVSGTGSRRIVQLMKNYNSKVYLSGGGGNKYHDLDDFKRESIIISEMPDILQMPVIAENEIVEKSASILEWIFMAGVEGTRRQMDEFIKNIRLK